VIDTALVGRTGENIAVQYLIGQGYKIRDRNVRFGRLEIDIVAYDKKRKMMVFVEVKARLNPSSKYPIRTAVDLRKRRALRQAVAKWVNENEYEGPGRIDIICVGSGKIQEHIMDIGSDFF